MKLIKRLVTLVVLLVVLVGVGAFAAFAYIDSIAKAAVEKGGTYALGVPTKLGSADVGILKGGFEMKGLDVNNPPGYKSASFLTMGDGGVNVKLDTLRKEIVEIPRLALSDISVNLEKSEGKANYQVILDNLKKLESGEPSNKPKDTGSGKKFVINQVEISNVKVHVDLLPVGGSLTTVNLTLDKVALTDVGTAGKGVPLPELASIIVKALMSAIVDKGGGIIPADLLGDLQGQLAQLKNLDQLGVKLSADLSKEAQKAIEGVQKDVQKKVEEATKDAGKKLEEGLKGLIPGGDKKK
jgi:hypothetical protein